MLAIVKDDRVDPFNRLLFAYLFSNYNYHLPDGDLKNDNERKLNETIKTLPEPALIAWKDN